jgi:hypothetical protein
VILAYAVIAAIVVAVLVATLILHARAREDSRFRRNGCEGERRVLGFRRR